MSLRAKLFGAFTALAVIPLVALSVFEYVRTMEAARRMVGAQTAAISARAALQIADRLRLVEGDLRLLAENEQTAALYEASSRSDAGLRANALQSARRFFDQAWETFGSSYYHISLRDRAGREVAALGPGFDAPDTARIARGAHIVALPIRLRGEGAPVGTLAASVRLEALAPREVMEVRFGRTGHTVLTNERGSFWHDGTSTSRRSEAGVTFSSAGMRASEDSAPLLRTFRFSEHDTVRVASVATVPGSSLVVVSSASMPEFMAPFAELRAANLAIALSLTVALLLAFFVVTRRTTRPLEQLTFAAEEVGRGNFAPTLPPPAADEVGRLSAAFRAMSGHIDRMMRELDQSRQMAAVGSFARQVAHEIRNPLTSIKLNLQSLERDARDGVIPADRRRTLEICLQEIQRLDRAVRGVLTLGRVSGDVPRRVSLVAVVERAIGVVTPQLREQGIALDYIRPAESLAIVGDEERLVGVFLNLFVNAAEAMPSGGTLRVAIQPESQEGGLSARVLVSDTGPGIPAAVRARIFEPFFTTKAAGSGLGLAVASRDAERHGGRIELGDANGSSGARFQVVLPLRGLRA